MIQLCVFDPAHFITTQIFLNASCDAEQVLSGCASIWDQMIGISTLEKGLEHFNLWKIQGQDKTWSRRRKQGKRKLFFLILRGKWSNFRGIKDKQDEWTLTLKCLDCINKKNK